MATFARIKRAFDVAASFVGLIVLSPFLVLVALFIKIGSLGPVFYRGVRTGMHGRPFKIYKFRTMVADAEQLGGPSTAFHDARLTTLGRYLRRYKVDELPQLINVLRGDMSIVGPRPQVEQYTARYTDEEKLILTVRPGLTDYASIKFINLDRVLGDEEVDDKYLQNIEPEKNRLRLEYVTEQSLWVDLKILYLTLVQLARLRSLWNTRD